MFKRVSAETGQRMVLKYDWSQLLIIPFNIKETLPDAARKVEGWLQIEQDDWYGDDAPSDGDRENDVDDDMDEKERRRPSCLVIGCLESRIQGPVLYVLVAGATDDLDVSVKNWNKNHQETCIRICFNAFGQSKVRRRSGMLTFLRGLFDIGCVAHAHVYKRHRLSD